MWGEPRPEASPVWRGRVSSQLLSFQSWTAEVGSWLGEHPLPSLGVLWDLLPKLGATLEPYTTTLAMSLPLPLPVREKAAWGQPGQGATAWPLCPWPTKPRL